MFRRLAALALVGALVVPLRAEPDPAHAARATYEAFVAAQNAHDLARVRQLLWDEPGFLWVSDGTAFWGRDVMLARMAEFQKAEIWRVEPRLDRATAVAVAPDAATLNLPLDLVIGPAAAPERWHFLVSVLCVETPAGWRIAALFTTYDKNA